MNGAVDRVRTQRRARLAVLACVIWLLGVEVLPALHEATHASAAPHRHIADGLVVTVSFDEPAHRHADGTIHTHTAQDAPPARKPARDRRSRVRDDVPHAGGLAHHATALIAAAPPLTSPLPVDRRPTLDAQITAPRPVSLDPLGPCARGPPTVG